MALLQEALRQNKPILAICRGVQLVNVAFGGTLNRRLKVIGKVYLLGLHILLRQLMAVLWSKLFGKESQVNSVHRQSIKDLAPNFRVTAVDPRRPND